MLFEWTESSKKWIFQTSSEMKDQFRLIRFYREMNNSLLFLNVNPDIQRSGYRKIDVWWDPGQDNGSFMLLLAHLIVSSSFLGEAKITIKTVVLREKINQTRELLGTLVQRSRIKAEINVLCPDSMEEESRGFEYERIQKRKQRQQNIFKTIQRIIGWDESVVHKESLKKIEFFKIPAEDYGEEMESGEISEDNIIKEELSGQMEDKDAFIINKNITRIIMDNSKNADLVMLGFNIPPEGREKKYIEKMDALLDNLPDTLLINCPFDFELFY
jgi:hypothetical protein